MKLLSITWPIKRNLLLCAALLIILSLLLWKSPPEQLQDVLVDDTPEGKVFPISYMLDTKIVQYAVDGSPAYKLETAKFAYYEGQGATPDDRRTNSYATLEKPFMILYGNSNKSRPWRASAAKGESRNQGELVILMDDVRIWQVQNGVVTNELTTQLLIIKPKERFAQTDKPIIAKTIGGTTKATGMNFFINSSQIEFLSQVRGVYEEP